MSEFVIENGVLKKYIGDGVTAAVPEGVTRIGEGAFCDCPFLKCVKISRSVEVIERRAFYECTSLERVELYSGVRRVAFEAFGKCTALKDVVVTEVTEETVFPSDLNSIHTT